MQTFNTVPIGDRILVLADRPETKTAGGLELPKEAQDIPVEGTVVALGTGHGAPQNVHCPVKVGDRVLFTEYTGTQIKVGKKDDKYLVMRPDELLAVTRDQGEPRSSSASA